MKQIRLEDECRDRPEGRYGKSSRRGRGGPAFWFKNLTAEIWKIVNKIKKTDPVHSFMV